MSSPGWQPLLDRLARETDPVVRRNLEVVARHVVEEVGGNIPALLDTLVPDPEYRVWGASTSVGPRGRDQVSAWYQALIDSGRNRLDYVIHRVVADAAAVVTEGDFVYAIPGEALTGHAAAESGEPVTADAWYLVQHRALVVWPVDDAGLIEGEHIFAGESHRLMRRLADGERPELGPASRAPAAAVR